MSKIDKSVKDVKSTVTLEAWKELRILAIQREISFPELVTQILENYVSRKKVKTEETSS